MPTGSSRRSSRQSSRLFLIWLAGFLAAALVLPSLSGADWKKPKLRRGPVTEDKLSVFFSPGGGAAEQIIRLIGQARSSIKMQAFVFTHREIADALIKAKQRGIDIEVIFDRQAAYSKGSQRAKLEAAGIKTIVGPKGMKVHNKTVVIDEKTVVTGSFNFTYSADEYNAENIVIIRDRDRIAEAYAAYHDQVARYVD